jgi:Niemann-Pick C1 protein
MVNLALSFSAVFIVTCILLGFDFHTSFLILLCVFMIISDMFGVMYLWNIQLNAISVVNIIMVKFRVKKKKRFRLCSVFILVRWYCS